MDQRIKSRNESSAFTPINRGENVRNLGLMPGREQQEKVSVSEKEQREEEAAERGLQATRKKQRGKYKQYEDSQVIVCTDQRDNSTYFSLSSFQAMMTIPCSPLLLQLLLYLPPNTFYAKSIGSIAFFFPYQIFVAQFAFSFELHSF